MLQSMGPQSAGHDLATDNDRCVLGQPVLSKAVPAVTTFFFLLPSVLSFLAPHKINLFLG